MVLNRIVFSIITLFLVFNCNKPASLSNNVNCPDELSGTWQLVATSINGEDFDDSIADYGIVVNFDDDAVKIDYGIYGSISGEIVGVNENQNELQFDFKDFNPFYKGSSPCIYQISDSNNLLLKIVRTPQSRPPINISDTNYSIYKLAKM